MDNLIRDGGDRSSLRHLSKSPLVCLFCSSLGSHGGGSGRLAAALGSPAGLSFPSFTLFLPSHQQIQEVGVGELTLIADRWAAERVVPRSLDLLVTLPVQLPFSRVSLLQPHCLRLLLKPQVLIFMLGDSSRFARHESYFFSQVPKHLAWAWRQSTRSLYQSNGRSFPMV